jgi:hypothetical protein
VLKFGYLREVCLVLMAVIGHLSTSGKGSRFGCCKGSRRSATGRVTVITLGAVRDRGVVLLAE